MRSSRRTPGRRGLSRVAIMSATAAGSRAHSVTSRPGARRAVRQRRAPRARADTAMRSKLTSVASARPLVADRAASARAARRRACRSVRARAARSRPRRSSRRCRCTVPAAARPARCPARRATRLSARRIDWFTATPPATTSAVGPPKLLAEHAQTGMQAVASRRPPPPAGTRRTDPRRPDRSTARPSRPRRAARSSVRRARSPLRRGRASGAAG